MDTTSLARRTLVAALSAAALIVGVGLPASPAIAATTDTDRPKLTANGFDFGESWDTFGAPLNGGHLYWDVTNDIVTIRLTGWIYIKNEDGECASLTVLYHDADHDFLGSQSTGEACADGNQLNKFWTDLRTPDTIASADIDHVFITLNHRLSFNTWETVASATCYNNG
jgi:hypothetical protein